MALEATIGNFASKLDARFFLKLSNGLDFYTLFLAKSTKIYEKRHHDKIFLLMSVISRAYSSCCHEDAAAYANFGENRNANSFDLIRLQLP